MAYLAAYLTKEDPLDNLSCTVELCTYNANSSKDLLKHFRVVHSNFGNINSPCLFSRKCPHTECFRSYRGLVSHLRKFHPAFFNKSANSDHLQTADTIDDTSAGHLSIIEENIHPPTDVDFILPSQTVTENLPTINVAAGNLVMHLLAEHKQTQVEVQSVMKVVKELVDTAVNVALDEAKAVLKQSGCHHVAAIQDIDAKSVIPNLFFGLNTQYSQINFFKKNFGLIMPETVSLPLIPEDFGRHKTRAHQSVLQQNYVCVPMLDQIEQMLNVDDIHYEIFEKPIVPNVSGLLSRYEDGTNYKKCKLYQLHPRAIQIHLYIDEVQMCNPIGSYSHKIVFVYFSLANVPFKMRSRLQFIHLLAIFYFEQTAFYSLNTLLKPIIDEIKRFEDGVEMDIKGRKTKVYGTLTAIVADNLASHQIGGFKSGFGKGFRKCRTCLAIDIEIQTKFTDFQFIHRKSKDHDEQCETLGDIQLQSHYSWLYGIHHTSVLNELKYFHVVGGLPPNVMHDLLEGVIPKVICELLCYLISSKLITLNQLNYIIHNYNYGHNEIGNKPSIIKMEHLTKKRLRQSASQNWLLFVNLPIMIGHLVPILDNKWDCFLTLIELTRLVFKESFSIFDLLKLGSLVSDFLSSYKKYFQNRIIPKMHHLVHYPYYIQCFGPLCPLWCMRFEGKHSYFKSLLRSTNNFINVPWTLAYRHQQWMSNKISKSKGQMLKDEVKAAKAICVSLNSFAYGEQVTAFFKLGSIVPFPSVESIHWFKKNSTIFKRNETVILVPPRNSLPCQFGLVVNVICFNGRYALVCKMFQTKKLCRHLQCYKVSFSGEFVVIDPMKRNYSHVFALHQVGFKKPRNNIDYFVVTRTELLKDLMP